VDIGRAVDIVFNSADEDKISLDLKADGYPTFVAIWRVDIDSSDAFGASLTRYRKPFAQWRAVGWHCSTERPLARHGWPVFITCARSVLARARLCRLREHREDSSILVPMGRMSLTLC